MASHPISVFGSSSTSPSSADQNYSGSEGAGGPFSVEMNSNKAAFDRIPHSQSGFPGFGAIVDQVSSHQSWAAESSVRGSAANSGSKFLASIGDSRGPGGKDNDKDNGQKSMFSSRLPHLGSGGNLTIVGGGGQGDRGQCGRGGPCLDWDRLVEGVFTEEIAKLL